MNNLQKLRAEKIDLADTPDIDPSLPARAWLYAWILDPDRPGNHQKYTERSIAVLIVANLFALIFEHVPAVYEANQRLFDWFDAFSVAIFTLE